ncbi:MFS transporter [Marinobacterium sp. YM272]|uniref:MFS transporter n=1 Tax=Marinobacterium sp. YM272 TaxID=3421654 RepID=UPI003D7F46DE
MQQKLIQRISPILLAISAYAVSLNLFFVLLPIRMSEQGISTSNIGLAMSMFSAGAILAGLLGSRTVQRVGHIRAFASMAATLAIIAICHSYVDNVWVTGFLRLLSGFCFVTGFITLESWLNVLSDKSNRGRIFSIYQICVAIGFGSAPFLLNLSVDSDPRLFGLIGLFLSLSLIIMAMSRIPVPEVPDSARPMSLKKLWYYSPSGTLSSFCAGMISAASLSLISLYAYERGFSGIWLALILGSYQLGGLLTQYPTGWLADRFDKRTVASGLMVLGVISNLLIVFDYFYALPVPMLVGMFLVSGGAGVALFPLAVTQVFDHIEWEEAMPATSTLQILLGIGGVLGPLIAGFLMSSFEIIWLYYYLIAVHAAVVVFLMVRRLFIRTERLESTSPYQLTTQASSIGASQLDPRMEYSLAEINDPALKLLLVALRQHPDDPGELIRTALDSAALQPEDVATQMVLTLPKQSGDLMKQLVDLYPEHRMAITHSLHELFELHKQRINSLIEEGLLSGASEEEAQTIREMIQAS